MLQHTQDRRLQDICASIMQAGDLGGLKRYAPAFERHKFWVGNGGLSPLHLSVLHNQVEMCRFLLGEGITPSVTEPFTKKTPLHIAAYLGHLDIVRVLNEFGADLDGKDCLYCSPIHYAAMSRNKDVILYFLENRMALSSQSIFGNVLDVLIRKRSVDLVEFFSNIGGVEALDCYYWNGDPSRSIGDERWTPFHSAAVSGQREVFEMLITKFPHVPAARKVELGCSGLEIATSAADLALLQGDASMQKMLRIERDTEEYRRVFMEENWYETDFPKRKELCDAIRYRNIERVDEIIRRQGLEVIFERGEKTWQERIFRSLENPNALDFAAYVYSLPFFDFLIGRRVDIPDEEFMSWERRNDLFFNWALMELHPGGEGFLRRLSKGGAL